MPPVTLSSKVIMTDVKPSSDMFMGAMVNKDANSRDNEVQKYVSEGFSQILHPVSGEPMSKEDFNNTGWKLEYIGYDSPLNFKSHAFRGSDQTIMPHRAQVKDSEGKVIGSTVVSRTDSEKKTKEFKASKIINNVYKRAVLNSGEWTYASTKGIPAKGFEKTAFKYNKDGTVDVKMNNGKILENQDVNILPMYIYENYKE